MNFHFMFIVAIAVLTAFCYGIARLAELPGEPEKLSKTQEELTAGICMALFAIVAAPFLCCFGLLSIQDSNLVGLYFVLVAFLGTVLAGLFWMILYFSYASLNDDDEDFISEDDITF